MWWLQRAARAIVETCRLTFTVTPATIAVVPASAATDASGLIAVVVTPPANWEGPAIITATDVASGQTDPPIAFRVQ